VGYARIPGLYNAQQVQGWKLVTDAVHAAGGKIVVQLMHTGWVTHQANLPVGARVVSSVAGVCSGQMWTDAQGMQPHTEAQALTEAEIAQTVAEFAQSSRLAIEAGFDGVELHADNGYLLEQFLNPNVNTRADGYGGGIEGRNRFVLEVARAAAQAFVATTPPGRDWELLGPNGMLGDLDRRSLDWADRCCMAGGAAQIGAGGGRAFLEVVCRRFDELRLALPSLHVVLDGLLSSQAITNELAALATGCFKPARGLPESIQDLVAIEDACFKLIFPMEEHHLLTATQRVAWICSMMQDTHARGGGGGGGGASSGSGEPSDPGTMTLIRAALSSPAARAFFTELRALLDAAPPNSLTISRKLTSSPIAFIKRMGTGVAPPASYTSTLWRDEFDRASLYVVKDKWRYNLSMRLAADKSGKVRQTAEKWRIDALTAAAIADYRFDEVDWFGLIYDVRGVQGDTDFVRAPDEIHFSEIDHFTSLEMVVKRIENALSLDSAATNSLSSGVDKAHEYFKDNCNSELTRTDDITVGSVQVPTALKILLPLLSAEERVEVGAHLTRLDVRLAVDAASMPASLAVPVPRSGVTPERGDHRPAELALGDAQGKRRLRRDHRHAIGGEGEVRAVLPEHLQVGGDPWPVEVVVGRPGRGRRPWRARPTARVVTAAPPGSGRGRARAR
jgi:hypothetical protein